eukprot:g3435.t1
MSSGRSTAEKLASANLRGIGQLFSIQLIAKILSFTGNVFITRQVSPIILGAASIQLHLLYTTALTISREGVRRASGRQQNTNSSTENKEYSASLGWLAFLFGGVFVLPVLTLIFLFLPQADLFQDPATLTRIDYNTAICLTSFAALIELFGEPAFQAVMGGLQYGVRARVEGLCLLARCFLTLTSIYVMKNYGRSDLLLYQTSSSSNNAYFSTIIGFAIGHLGYAITFCIGFWSAARLELTAPSLQAIRNHDRQGDKNLRGAIYALTIQSAGKILLSEGSKLMMVGLASSTEKSDQANAHSRGAYGLVVNLGSLVARLVLLPVEENATVAFSQIAALRSCTPTVAENFSNNGDSSNSGRRPSQAESPRTRKTMKTRKRRSPSRKKEPIPKNKISNGTKKKSPKGSPKESSKKKGVTKAKESNRPSSKKRRKGRSKSSTRKKGLTQRKESSAGDTQPSSDTLPSSDTQPSSDTLRSSASLNKNHATLMALLSVLTKSVAYLGLVFLIFGPCYCHLLIRLLYGSQWSDHSDAPSLLQTYCVYVMFIAMNGITEAFVQAVASPNQLHRFNAFLVVSAVMHWITTFVLASNQGLNAGSKGYIWADTLNMCLRIFYSLSFIMEYHATNSRLKKSNEKSKPRPQPKRGQTITVQKKRIMKQAGTNIETGLSNDGPSSFYFGTLSKLLPDWQCFLTLLILHACMRVSEAYIYQCNALSYLQSSRNIDKSFCSFGTEYWLRSSIHVGSGIVSLVIMAFSIKRRENKYTSQALLFFRGGDKKTQKIE